jgi:chromosome segregation ATPase
MENGLADALLDFYQKMLKPEFDVIKVRFAENDERQSEILGHLDSIYHRLGRLEDESLMMNNRLKRIEDSIEAGNTRHSELEQSVKSMKVQLADLQSRLEFVERQLSA